MSQSPNLRRILLRIMLGSLAVAAGLGALAVLFVRNEAVWRIIGTGLVTAGAAALLLPISLLADKAKSRRSGLLAIGFVLVEYFLWLILIWDIPRMLGIEIEPVGLTALLLPSVAIPAIALLRMTATPATRIAGGVGVGMAALELIVLLVAIWGERLFSGSSQWYQTAGTTAIFFPMIIASLVGAGTHDRRWWRWIGVVTGAAALCVSIAGIWREHDDHVAPYTILVTLAATFAYANLLVQCPLKPGQAWLRWTTLLSVLITAACIDSSIILEKTMDRRDAGDVLNRISAAAGIIAGCGTLAMLILAALNRKLQPAPVAIASVDTLTIICPLCQKKQLIKTGGATCIACGLRIVIRLEEPHCEKCGYLLYGLKSDRCPECGNELNH